MFSTIIKIENGDMYHGYVLYRQGEYFTFAFRVNNKNYIWDCKTDYWRLLL